MKTKSKRNRKSSRTELNAKHAIRKIEREGEERARERRRERESARGRRISVKVFGVAAHAQLFLASSSFSRYFGSRTCGFLANLAWCVKKAKTKNVYTKNKPTTSAITTSVQQQVSCSSQAHNRFKFVAIFFQDTFQLQQSINRFKQVYKY